MTYPLSAVPTIPKWYVIMMNLLGAVLTLISFFVPGHYAAEMSLNIYIGCGPNLTQLVYVAKYKHWVQS